MEKQGTRAHLGHELALLRRLKAQRYDLVVNPPISGAAPLSRA